MASAHPTLSCQQCLVNRDRVDGTRRSRFRSPPHHDHHQVRSTGDLGIPLQSPLEHMQRRLELIHGRRRRCNRRRFSPTPMSLRDRVHRFNSALLAAERLHVGEFKQVYTLSPGLPRSFERQSKSETLCGERSQTTGLNTWKPVPRPASRQKKLSRRNGRNSWLT